jgi:predicted 2-oxoglutarate/Fe(II)-dependent dioxygenase YbiX
VSAARAIGGEFLSPALCDGIVREAEREAWWQWSEIDQNGAPRVNLDFRRGQWCVIPRSCQAVLAARLLAVGRGLARHFGPMRGFEGPNLLRYRGGDFFRAHQDEHPSTLAHRRRKLTITAFLNDRGFDGGVLRLHGLDGGRPLDVTPRAGRFVAFPADTVHEVSRIGGGNRYTLVAWMY